MRKLKSPFAAGAVIIVGIGYKGAVRNKIGVEDIFFKGIEKEFPVAHHFFTDLQCGAAAAAVQ